MSEVHQTVFEKNVVAHWRRVKFNFQYYFINGGEILNKKAIFK